MGRDLDQVLAYHCGPALTGLKAANLISVDREGVPDLRARLGSYCRTFGPRGVYFRILCECSRHTLLLVYDRGLLEDHLALPEAQALLMRDGYPAGAPLKVLLDRLSRRLECYAEFPHEIGLFLGYPPEDVEGFQRHRGRNCKLCGYWKVYSDVDRARELFRRYDQCRDSLCRRVARGMTLTEVFRAA